MKKRGAECTTAGCFENSLQARVEGLWRISWNDFGKYLQGRIESCVVPSCRRRLEAQDRSEKNLKIGEKCASPRILQRHFQFCRQDFRYGVLFDRTFVKQTLFIAEAKRRQIRNPGRRLQEL